MMRRADRARRSPGCPQGGAGLLADGHDGAGDGITREETGGLEVHGTGAYCQGRRMKCRWLEPAVGMATGVEPARWSCEGIVGSSDSCEKGAVLGLLGRCSGMVCGNLSTHFLPVRPRPGHSPHTFWWIPWENLHLRACSVRGPQVRVDSFRTVGEGSIGAFSHVQYRRIRVWRCVSGRWSPAAS